MRTERHRKPVFETLHARQMMAADVGFSAGALDIMDTDGVDSATSRETVDAAALGDMVNDRPMGRAPLEVPIDMGDRLVSNRDTDEAAAVEVMAHGDFNGDGYDDVAMGMPETDVAGVSSAGAVRILYGWITGLRTIHPSGAQENMYWTQDDISPSHAEQNDRFGGALQVGDFDADGFDDLAIGSPGENDGRGMVQVLFGGYGGLTPPIISQVLVLGRQEGGLLGASLSAGDLDNQPSANGHHDDELVIGLPGANNGRGEVRIYDVNRNEMYPQQVLGGKGRFGTDVAVGDFNGDWRDDLAVGAPNRDIHYKQWSFPTYRDAKYVDAGRVYVYHGSDEGLNSSPARSLSQTYRDKQGGPFPTEVKGVPGRAEDHDHFGSVLAVGDFDRDRIDDLAIGVPDEDIDRYLGKSPSGATIWDINPDAGAVNVVYGSTKGLRSRLSEIWHQGNNHGSPDLAGQVEAGDRFGASLAVGDFNGEGIDDLAIGIPQEDWNGEVNAGVVEVLVGDRMRRLTQFPDERPPWTEPSIAAHGQFGYALSAGDVNGDGILDLGVSAPHSLSLHTLAAGSQRLTGSDVAVHMLYGGEDGPGTHQIESWYEATERLEETGADRARQESNGQSRSVELAIRVPTLLGNWVDRVTRGRVTSLTDEVMRVPDTADLDAVVRDPIGAGWELGGAEQIDSVFANLDPDSTLDDPTGFAAPETRGTTRQTAADLNFKLTRGGQWSLGDVTNAAT